MKKEIQICDFCGKMDKDMSAVVLPMIKRDVVKARKGKNIVAVHRIEKIEPETIDLCSDCNKNVAISIYAARAREIYECEGE